MRVAIVDAYGDTLNEYRDRRLSATVPSRPWAVYLAGTDHRFRLLAFDFDAKTDAAAAARDAGVLAGLLTDAAIAHTVCQSGPTGGRHVWIGLAESIDAATVATLARLVKHLCPTLDLSPLTNPVTGCVRPPGSPHRHGGSSTVLSGELNTLTNPTTTAGDVAGLVTRLAALVDDTEPARADNAHSPLPMDAHGRLHLVGVHRPLPATSAAALHSPLPAAADASAVLWRILIGAAASRWHHADVAALVPTAPGLEHVRSEATSRGRRPRRHAEHAGILARQWDKAVRYVASSDRRAGDDPTFDTRADAIASHARAVQDRADASAGRWAHGGGPADRRILDVLCVLALQALRGAVEADTRRLALLAGVGRETARTALLRLAADGWIVRTSAADGPHGASWSIDPRNALHTLSTRARSQADPRPLGAGAAERTALLSQLHTRITAAAHDLFTPARPALGLLAGNVYARLGGDPVSVDELARTGVDPRRARAVLRRLHDVGLIERSPAGWSVDRSHAPDVAAEQRQVSGRLDARAAAYRIEREAWAWWKAEEGWMRAPRRPDVTRRPGRGQLSLVPDDGTHAYGPHPRRADGRLDYAEARRIVVAERAGAARRTTPARRRLHSSTPTRPIDELLGDLLGAVRIA